MTPSYDPMIAKLVVWGKDRATAVSNLRRVLMESRIAGPITNMDYCRAILETEGAVEHCTYVGEVTDRSQNSKPEP